ncbi:TadE family type IV pilus minor pilin [Aestuariimicrobium kwangyangense]|uniref:TadE family type IV pilus minor pilin n=1 Tax=Aestuariimicrobium kwangyangense TaxID=396389 RepID=UPI001FE03757|nr:TadE family type IV pilus minor pilin [Aestuariimicrobium kwangyangense]
MSTSIRPAQIRRSGRPAQRGMVTVELAIGLIFAALVLFACSAVIGLAILQGQCEDTATQVARQESRGDESAARRSRQAAPRAATITTTTKDGWVTVVVSAQRGWGTIGPVTISGEASLPLEPNAQP